MGFDKDIDGGLSVAYMTLDVKSEEGVCNCSMVYIEISQQQQEIFLNYMFCC